MLTELIYFSFFQCNSCKNFPFSSALTPPLLTDLKGERAYQSVAHIGFPVLYSLNNLAAVLAVTTSVHAFK